jgi:hypothetical protein
MENNIKYPHMKKGTQYSHYVGGDLLEIICGLDMALDKNLASYMEGEEASNDYWVKYVKDRVNELRIKIGELDSINKMDL